MSADAPRQAAGALARTDPRRCVIYTRFSPRKNEATCESCEVQEAYCQQFADKKGWAVRAVYTDKAVSGTTEIEGRHLQEAIFSLKKGDVLLAYRRDRLARDLIIGLQIERTVESLGASVAVVDGDVYGSDPASVMMRQILMVVAEYERKAIAARTSAAMLHYQREGRRMSKSCPFGWAPDPADASRMVRDEKQQRIIEEIVAMREQKGLGYLAIANALNARGDGGGKGTPWYSVEVMRVYKRSK